MTDVARCRACGAVIKFGTTDNGRPIPLDPEPRPAGDTYANVAVSRDERGNVLARVLSKERPGLRPWEDLYVPHFATCPRR